MDDEMEKRVWTLKVDKPCTITIREVENEIGGTSLLVTKRPIDKSLLQLRGMLAKAVKNMRLEDRGKDSRKTLNVGDAVIFWDDHTGEASIGALTMFTSRSNYPYEINGLYSWKNAVKWDMSKKHLERIIKGNI